MISTITSEYLFIYLCVVGVVGAFFIWWTRKNIIKIGNQKSKRIEKLNSFEAIKTASPLDTPDKAAKDNAIESVENRFTIIKKIFMFSFALLWLIALFLQIMKLLVSG